ncbi:divergent polysaccharide deacetylase family protein [Paenibacillus sp. N1-5-1-14]|uniref:divergent polysaccharide deacetylase family protein n=1 Tax=Paenibacillus radicibacter TaxID=2972488 RepID=UPI0021593B2C|nr:divergent polysaccharide deacetylase family protein [Paenibacillus radicibacter]MCR8642455.1 divergent polysaccharide deacetylase family protein [Paenibacillus radicibacter]
MKINGSIRLAALVASVLISTLSSGMNTYAHAAPTQKAVKSAAIIIDDFGNNMKGTPEIIGLPYNITIAVMPFLPTTKQDAEAAYAAGKEVIVHMPMEAKSGKSSWLGPGAITVNLSDDEVRKRINLAIDEVPHAVGINNHMGSKITGDARIMRIILEECKKRNLFFIDSHTNYRSIVCQTAKEVGVRCLENQVFLDDVHTTGHVLKQMNEIAKRLETSSTCIAIGHVGVGGNITANVLKTKLPELAQQHHFAKISELLAPAETAPSEQHQH